VSVSLSVCVFDTRCINGLTNPSDLKPAWGAGSDSCGSKEPCIRWESISHTEKSRREDDRTTMRPFAKLFWTLVYSSHNKSTHTVTRLSHVSSRRICFRFVTTVLFPFLFVLNCMTLKLQSIRKTKLLIKLKWRS